MSNYKKALAFILVVLASIVAILREISIHFPELMSNNNETNILTDLCQHIPCDARI